MPEAEQRCRICNCSESEPCNPPCSWQEPNLCDACAYLVENLKEWAAGAHTVDLAALQRELDADEAEIEGGLGCEEINLGACCICAKQKRSVKNVLMLPFKSPLPGIGCWACVVCHLPAEGAVAVLCNRCLLQHQQGLPLVTACVGEPGSNVRVPVSQLTQPYAHDMSLHQEEEEQFF